VAILEDDRLVELLVDHPESSRTLGNIYRGRVDAVLPGIQAAFVDIGTGKSAFLHASDLIEADEDDDEDDDEGGNGDAGNGGNGETAENGENGEPATTGGGGRRGGRGGGGGGGGGGGRGRRHHHREAPNVQDVLKRGQTLLVQVTKESMGTKGPRVTAQISLPGRFLVFLPHSSRVGVSRKIEARDERARLRKMVSDVLPKDSGGVIVRTVSEDVTDEHIKRELQSLIDLWSKIKRKEMMVRPPSLVQREASLTSGLIRDVFSDKVDKLVVDTKNVFNEIKRYLEQVDPELLGRVTFYQDSTPLFDKFEIESEIRDLFKRRVDLPSGGYVIIEPTEALVSIDVNTGKYTGTGKKDPEKTILKTNMDAAQEIARQLRLRDVGGIIVIDFIDMETQGNRDKVLHELRDYLVRDRARTRAFQVSELGLIEMTRQRVRPSLWHSMTVSCPACNGTGRVFRPEVVVRRLERSLRRVALEKRERQMTVRLHPEVALFLLEQEPHFLREMRKSTGMDLELRDDPGIAVDEFRMVAQPAGRDVTEKYAVA
jgi:ribonuclease G